MIEIFYTGTDLGDGSLGVAFFYSRKCIELLEDHDPETYRGEGGGSFKIPVDAVFTSGLSIRTLEDVISEIDEYEEWASQDFNYDTNDRT